MIFFSGPEWTLTLSLNRNGSDDSERLDHVDQYPSRQRSSARLSERHRDSICPSDSLWPSAFYDPTQRAPLFHSRHCPHQDACFGKSREGQGFAGGSRLAL